MKRKVFILGGCVCALGLLIFQWSKGENDQSNLVIGRPTSDALRLERLSRSKPSGQDILLYQERIAAYLREKGEAEAEWARVLSLKNPDEQRAFVDAFISELTVHDLAEAINYCQSLIDQGYDSELIIHALGALSTSTRVVNDRLLTLFHNEASGAARSRLIGNAITSSARSMRESDDLYKLAALTENVSDSKGRIRGTIEIARIWGQIDYSSALRWIESVSSEEDRVAALDYLIPKVGAGLSGKNATMAVESAFADSNTLEVKRHLAARMVDIISDDDPGKVKDWILSQPENVSAPAIKTFIKNMANESPKHAIELINVLPEASQKLAIQQFGTAYAQVNPLASAEWALNSDLGDAEYDVGFSIAVMWKSRDASAATRWANNLRPSPLRIGFEQALKQ